MGRLFEDSLEQALRNERTQKARSDALLLLHMESGAARQSDPDTSWDAACRDLHRRTTDRVRALVVHYNNPDGLTDFELGDIMDRQQTSAGKRRGELRDIGLIEATNERRNAPSGSPAIVWAITEAGRYAHLELMKIEETETS